MKRLISFLFIGILSAAMLTACNKAKSDNSSLLALLGLGGGGGTQFIKQYGTSFTSSNDLPLSKDYDCKAQYLYTAAEIGGSGLIRSIRLHLYNGTGGKVTCPNVSIKMGHTDLSALTTAFAANVETGQGSEMTVLDNKTIGVPRSTDGDSHWVDIPLETPFNYNGVDNLVVDFECPTKCSGEVGPYYAASANRAAWSIATDTQPGVAEYDPGDATVGNLLVLMQFVFAGGDNHIIYDATPTTNALFGFGSNRSQMLYTKDEINGSGTITGIGLILGSDNADDDNPYTVTVSLGHTTASELGYTAGTTTWDTYCNAGSPVTVANAASFKVPAGTPAGTCLWLPLQSSFNYNGTDNLIFDITVTGGDENTFIAKGDILNRRLSGTTLDPGFLGSTAYNTRFRFAGGTMDLITTNAFNDQVAPFYDSAGGYQIQTLYRSSELGLGGSITGMSLRLYYPSIADTYSDFRIIIGQTDATTLTYPTDFADNMENEITVYSGTVTIPAGLAAGDWIDIPFSGEFACDPQKSLVIHYVTGSGNEFNETCFYNSSTIYNDRYITRDNSTFASGNSGGDGVHAVRFTLR